MYKIILVIGLSLFLSGSAHARHEGGGLVNRQADSLRHYLLPEVRVVGKVRSKRYYERLRDRDARTRHNVRRAYPYAKEAARRIEQIEARLSTVSTEKERKEIIKTEYDNLMKRFKEPLMKLTITQGRILVRLIYRETRKSSFYHIKEYKGGVNAYFWQSLALLFGNNLKADYDPDGTDFEIEQIVQEIERGDVL
ncbi:MAG: DUF4294 domain-containing protein [Odoribacteraceae bacterium]|jgi:hypothetical protein|nr:DUF4294 domain-containing protein [Odoribacteraceae bacterium]